MMGAMMAIVPLMAAAQKSVADIEQVFDTFVGWLADGGYVTASATETYSDGSYYKKYEFAAPKGKLKTVEELDRALSRNSVLGYESLVKRAGTNSADTKTIAYGKRNASKIQFGTHKDRNYNVLLMRSRTDTTMRYVYALVWYETKEQIAGNVYKIYGKDPAKRVSVGVYGMPGLSSLQSLSELSDGGMAHTVTTISSDGKVRMIRNGKVVEVDSIGAVGAIANMALKTSADFVIQLNTLHTTYLNPPTGTRPNQQHTLRTAVMGRVLKLCREHGKLLTSDDREFCRNVLMKWKKLCAEDLHREMLRLALKGL